MATTGATAARENNLVLGGGGDDVVFGAGEDFLGGSEGDDRVFGGIGNDTLCGDDGADVLSGGEGDDYLNGGAGIDRLTGGAGSDTFVLSPPFLDGELMVSDRDLITDFVQGEDRINVREWFGGDFTFRGTRGFTGSGMGELRFTAQGSGTLVLGGVDKFEPVSGGCEVDPTEEAAGQSIAAGCNGPIDLEVAEHALDAVALLVERPVMLDLHPTV